MISDVFAFYGIFVVLLFAFGELGQKKILGVFASLLFLILGLVVYVDNLTFSVSDTKIISTSEQDSTETVLGITTTNKTISGNETTTRNYAPPAALPYVPLTFAQLIGLSLLLISMYGLIYYAYSMVRYER